MNEAEAEVAIRKMAREVADPLGGVLRSLLAMVDKERRFLASAMTVIENFRPLVKAVQAFREYPVRAHDCPGFDCATCPPRGELERAWEGIADMVSDADADVGVETAPPLRPSK